MIEIKLCDRGKTNTVKIVEQLKKIYDNPRIIVECQSVCAICQTKCFAIVNGQLLIAENDDDLIDKIKKITL